MVLAVAVVVELHPMCASMCVDETTQLRAQLCSGELIAGNTLTGNTKTRVTREPSLMNRQSKHANLPSQELNRDVSHLK